MKIKHLGNFDLAKEELKNNKNNAVSYIYENKIISNKLINNPLLKDAIFTIKENFATNDSISHASSKILENFKPSYEATAITKLTNNGAIKVAKVYCDELALGGTGTYSAFGLIKHENDNNRYAGGSSSGSVATLTNSISFALASDTGDSVRLPASYWGKVGFKPSYGAISRYGMFAYASSLDTVAYFAHNVNDVCAISQSLYGLDEKDFTTRNIAINEIKITKPKKVLFLNLDGLNLWVSSQYHELAQKLKKEKIEIIYENIKEHEDLLFAIKPVYEIISYSEASSNLSNLNGIAFGSTVKGNNWAEIMTNTRSRKLGKMVQKRLVLGAYFLHEKNQNEMFWKALKVRRLIKNYFNSLHEKADLVIFPCSANVAPLFKDKFSNHYMEYILTGSNLAGNPSLSLPWISRNNLFVNLSLDTTIYKDEQLLSYALWFEEFLKGDKNE